MRHALQTRRITTSTIFSALAALAPALTALGQSTVVANPPGPAPDVLFSADSGGAFLIKLPFGAEGHGDGGAFVDLNDDGYADLYLPQGDRQYLENTTSRGDQIFLFDSSTGIFGVLSADPTMQRLPNIKTTMAQGNSAGAIAGDYDNDGKPDLYILNFNEPNVLLENQYLQTGVLSFLDVTASTDPTPGVKGDQYGVGVAVDEGVILNNSISAVWADFDRDGDLDLYVAGWNYHNGIRMELYADPPGPGERGTLYMNQLMETGSATFRDETLTTMGDPDAPIGLTLGDVRPILLGRMNRLFLKVNPIFLSATYMPDSLHSTPSRSRSSAAVASGCSATNSARRARSILMTPGPPILRGDVSPVSRRRCLMRLAHAGLTQNIMAMRLVFMPRSYAASTRSRRS